MVTDVFCYTCSKYMVWDGVSASDNSRFACPGCKTRIMVITK